MSLKRSIIAALIVLIVVVDAGANRQDGGITAIKTVNGFLLVWNQPGNHFTVEVKGKAVKPLNSTEHVFFDVDGIVFQIQSVAVSEFLKSGKKPGQDLQSVLIAHKDWEAQYAESTFRKKLSVESSPQKLGDKGEALFWKYDMPEGFNQESRKQLFLTSTGGDYVVVLNGVVTDKVKEETVRQFLLDTILTLKVSSKPINVQELQEAIRRGSSR